MPVYSPSTTNMTLLYRGNVNMQTAGSDQALAKVGGWNEAIIRDGALIPRSGACSVACAGGIYDATSKGGNVIKAAATSWVALSYTASPKVPVNMVSTGFTTTYVNAANLYLYLDVGSTAAATGSIEIYGYIMS